MASADANIDLGRRRRAALLGGLALCAALIAFNAFVASAATTDSFGHFNQITVAASQLDGKVVTAGTTADCTRTVEGPPCESEVVVARFDPKGQLDSGFGGGDGILKVKLPGGQGNPTAIVLGQGGTITVGVSAALRNGEEGFSGLVRLQSDGSLDQSFGVGGLELLAAQFIHGIDALPTGGLVVLVEGGPGGLGGSRLVRTESDGSPDPHFEPPALSGLLEPEAGPVVGPDGRIYLAGVFGKDPHRGAGVLRLLPEGQKDEGFGKGGIGAIPTPEETNPGYWTGVDGLAVQAHGAAVVTARRPAIYRAPNPSELIRLEPNGEVDAGFDGGGVKPPPGASQCGGEIAVEPDGNLITGSSEFHDPPCIQEFTPAGVLISSTIGGPAGYVVGVQADGRVFAVGSLGGHNGYIGTSSYVSVFSTAGLDREFGLAFLPRVTCRGSNPTEVAVRRSTLETAPAVAVGTSGPDVIVGTRERDRISGGGGDDLICAGPGDDRVSGGAGADRIYGGAGIDRLEGDAGNDWIFGGPGWDRLIGGGGADHLFGGPGKDRALGGPGRDRVRP